MNELDYGEIHDEALAPLKPPGILYLGVLGFLGAIVTYMVILWIVQQKTGLHVTGLNSSIGWGVYIGNYVYWIAVAMSGTFISAMLYLVRSRFRCSISRGAETMTVIAVVIAGMYPLIHLGRLWVVYFMLPYPQGLQIWPNFMSPLFWDMLAITAYMLTSWILFYTGVIPDAAAAWHKDMISPGPGFLRTKLHRLMAMNWHGAASQWCHYKRSYLFLAALATPLAISIHSVTSWVFSMQLLPGWHTTFFAPYFVCGAILSGCGWTIIMLVPIRNVFHLKNIIKTEHLSSLALIMIPASIGLAYEYGIEPFLAWYSGDIYEKQFHVFEAGGWGFWIYWSLYLFNIIVPLTFIFRKLRRREWYIFGASLIINFGMWAERWFLTASSPAHAFLPHAWATYISSWVELSITGGTFALFALVVLVLIRIIPIVPIADVQEELNKQLREHEKIKARKFRPDVQIIHVIPVDSGVVGVFNNVETLSFALKTALERSFRKLEVYSPFPIEEVLEVFHEKTSPVRIWTLLGVLTGIGFGFFLAVITALENKLIVGGKPPVSFTPYWTIAFEFGVLFGAIASFYSFIRLARLNKKEKWPGFDPRFARDRFGLFIACKRNEFAGAMEVLKSCGCIETHEVVKLNG